MNHKNLLHQMEEEIKELISEIKKLKNEKTALIDSMVLLVQQLNNKEKINYK